ncbi:MAG: hypothetical protein P1U63_03820 [Coxiellaceae bacterium]|nr:hypothetical protein [Coxiellaceae bacterium]
MSVCDRGIDKVQKFNNGQHMERFGFSAGFAEENKHALDKKDYGYEFSLSINLYRNPDNFTEVAAPGDDDFIDHRKAIIDYLLCDELEQSDDEQAKLKNGHSIFTSFSHLELTSEGYYSEGYARKQNNRRKHSGQIFILLRPQVSVEKLRAFIDDLQHFLHQLGIDRAPECLDTEFALDGAPNISMQLAYVRGEAQQMEDMKNATMLSVMQQLVKDTSMYALFAKGGSGVAREHEFDAIHELLLYSYRQLVGKRKPTAKQVAWSQSCQKMVRVCRYLQLNPEQFGDAHALLPAGEIKIIDILGEFFKRALKRHQRGDSEIEIILEAVIHQLPLLLTYGAFLYAREEQYLEALYCKSQIPVHSKRGYDEDSYEMLQALSRQLVVEKN